MTETTTIPKWTERQCSGCGRTVRVSADRLALYGWDRCLDCTPQAEGPNPYVRSTS